MFNILKIQFFIFLCSINFISCFTYGSPDSIFVNFVGMDLENYVKYEKKGNIYIGNMDYKIIYIKETLVEMGPPEKQAKGMYQRQHLIVKKMIDGSEEIIFSEGNNMGIQEKAIVDKDNHKLFYIFKETEYKPLKYKMYLGTYDLKNNQIMEEIMILENKEYISINELFFDNINNNLLFKVNFGKEYFILNIDSSKIDKISEKQYEQIIGNMNISENNRSYISDGITMKFFSISPFSDYLPANYKHKYNGIYINDGTNNIHISKVETYLLSPILWLEGGKYFIQGSYLFDTSGKMKEVKIADGNIIAIY